MSSAANSSVVWNYFKKIDFKSVSCNLCGKTYKTSGNTTNLATHLKSKHHHAYAQLFIKSKTKVGNAINITHEAESTSNVSVSNITYDNDTDTANKDLHFCKIIDNQDDELMSISNISNSSVDEFTKIKQPTLSELFDKSADYKDGGQRHTEITQSLIYMIVKDNMPFSCVEKEGLKKFVHATCPRYKLPSRFKVTGLVEQRYYTTKTILRKILGKINYVALSSDILTVTNSTRSFLVITIHFLSATDEILESFCLSAQRMLQTHTGEYIRQLFEEITSEFYIEKNQIVSITTDGGSNMVAAVKLFLGENKRIPCTTHLINLIVDGVLKNNAAFSTLADQIKAIVTYFKQSVSASDELKAEQEAGGKKEGQVLMLIQSVNTRWNSCFDMMERFLQLSVTVAKILAARGQTNRNVPDMVTTSQLNILRDLITLLGPFKLATEEISGEKYVTASLVIPLSNLLRQEIEQAKPSTDVGLSVQYDLLKGINERLGPLEHNIFLAKATILDPRFKKIHFISSKAVVNVISELSKNISMEHKRRGNISPEVRTSPNTGESSNSSASLWARHEKMLTENISNQDVPSFGTMPAELKQYLDQPNISRTSNPLKFWIDSRHFIPVLSEIGQKYLISAASSVASEKVASTINIVVPNNRSRLTGEHIKERVFLKTIPEKYWYN